MRRIPKDQLIAQNIEARSLEQLNKTLDIFTFASDYKKSNKKLDANSLKTLFAEYNYYFGENQTGIWCSSCRATVFRGLEKIMPWIIKKIEDYA